MISLSLLRVISACMSVEGSGPEGLVAGVLNELVIDVTDMPVCCSMHAMLWRMERWVKETSYALY